MFTVNDIGKNYKKKMVLNHISLQVAPGECIGLLGIYVSGKSTLLGRSAGVPELQIIQTGQLRNQWIFLWKKADRFIRFVKRISAMILSESAGQNTNQR